MSNPDPLSSEATNIPSSQDPWSDHNADPAPSTSISTFMKTSEMHGNSTRDDANGGASASMHAPAHVKAAAAASANATSFDRSGFPSSNLSARLSRTDSSFGSNKAQRSSNGSAKTSPAFNPWGMSNPKPEYIEPSPVPNGAGAKPAYNPEEQREDQVNSNGFADPLTTLGFHGESSRVQDPLSRDLTQPIPSAAVPTSAESAHDSEQIERMATVEQAEDEVDGSEDEDEAFVYPAATESEDAVSEHAKSGSPQSSSPIPVQESVAETAPNTTLPPAGELPAQAAAPAPTSVDVPASSAEAPAATSPPQNISLDYERLAQLCSQGPLSELQAFVSSASQAPPSGPGVSMFALANEPNPSNGLVPLHFAAKEGRTDIVKWLINEAGALVDLEDREGETPLHKAALTGKLSVISFLLAQGADVNAKDNDGWTALHNACSRGYLDIVRILVDTAKADFDVQGGRGGWTPLMNAASKGHLPIVRQLTSKYHADPFIRNASGETAFDVAAATFEVYICEVLEKYEAERWNASKYTESSEPRPSADSGRILPGRGPYDPLRLHSTVPVILHENQRLDTRFQTLAMHGGKPRWSSSSAARANKPDRRSPFSMPPGPLGPSRTRHAAMRREDVNLPTRAMPYKLRLRTRGGPAVARRQRAQLAARRGAPVALAREEDLASTPTPESVLRSRSVNQDAGQAATEQESSHFWLSEWQIDTTHPLVDVEQGWQYAQSFDALDDKWSSQPPPPLERLLEGRGLSSSVTRALTGGAGLATGQADQEASASGWVRRRRWVRVMRRRLDIEFGDELEACEAVLASGGAGEIDEAQDVDGLGRERGNLSTAAIMAAQEAARNECSQLGADADYVSRAKALAGSSASSGATPADAIGQDRDELARRIARLVMAITELRAAFEDEDAERRGRAEEVRREFTVQLGQLREAAGLDEDEDGDEAADDDEEEFIYPNSYKDDAASVFTRIPSLAIDSADADVGSSTAASSSRPALSQRQSSAASLLRGSIAPSEAGTTLAAARSADLAANRDFRVPTNEAPNRSTLRRGPALREQNLQPQWERDEDASDCRGCGRRFTFFLRKHHCRRCGRIFCDPCSSKRAQLSMQDLVVDPSFPGMAASEVLLPTRICNNCHAEMQLPPQLQNVRGGDALMPQRSSSLSSAASGGDDLAATRSSLAAPSDVSSRASELTECPVCSATLASLGGQEAQEAHVRNCLENGGGGSIQGGRYLVYKLPEASPIVGKECTICMEDFIANSMIARLPCLCYFHRGCIDSWFKRGRECPVHARSW